MANITSSTLKNTIPKLKAEKEGQANNNKDNKKTTLKKEGGNNRLNVKEQRTEEKKETNKNSVSGKIINSQSKILNCKY